MPRSRTISWVIGVSTGGFRYCGRYLLLFEESPPLIEPLELLGDVVLDEPLLAGELVEPELDPLIPDELELPPAAPVELEPDLLN